MAASKMLSPVDTAWLRMEHPTNLMMITGLLTFAGPLEYDGVREVIEQRLLRFRRFRQRVVSSRLPLAPPRWEDDPNFDIRYHLRRLALPAPGDQAALEELVSTLMSSPLDYARPLWQFHLIENYDGGSVLLGRLHHAIGDGIALMRVLLSLTDESPEARPEPVATDGHKSRGPLPTLFGTAQSLLGESLEIITDPARALDVARLGTDGALALGRLALRLPDPPTVFKGPLGVMKLAAWSQPLPLDDVKALGRVTGGTVNDVLLTAVTGALRRYLLLRGEAVQGLNFRAAVPVNLRPLDAPVQLGNKFGLVFLSLPVGLADPVERLAELRRRMAALKGSLEAPVALGLLGVFGRVPARVENIAVGLFGAKATAVMTNVPGPRQQIYLAGSPLSGMMFWVPQSGRLGLGVSIMSYNQQIWLGVAVDAGLVPDPGQIIEAFHTEFAEMMQLVYAVQADSSPQTNGQPAAQLCQAITQSGRRCRNRARPGSDYCHLHRPA